MLVRIMCERRSGHVGGEKVYMLVKRHWTCVRGGGHVFEEGVHMLGEVAYMLCEEDARHAGVEVV